MKNQSTILDVVNSPYKEGFETDVKSEYAPKGLNEEVIRYISKRKAEPNWLLDFRLKAYQKFLTMSEPHWLKGNYPAIDYQDIYYYSAPHMVSYFYLYFHYLFLHQKNLMFSQIYH